LEAVLKNEMLATKAALQDVETRSKQHRADIRDAEGSKCAGIDGFAEYA
jgi:hypothetical protein